MTRGAFEPGSWRVHYGYAGSTLGKSLPWCATDAFGLYFLTDVMDVGGYLAGLIILGLFIWAALCDPAAGWMIDRLLRAGRNMRHVLVVTALAMTFFFCLSFLRLPLPPAMAIVAVIGAGLAFRAAFAALDVPHNAMMASLVNEGAEPVGLSALRLAATLAASWFATLGISAVLGAPSDRAIAGFGVYGLVIGCVGCTLFLAFLPDTTIRPGPVRGHRACDPSDDATDWTAMLLLFASAVLATIVSGIFTKDLIYIAKYVFRDPDWVASAMTALVLGKLAGIPLWIGIARRFTPQLALSVAFSLCALVGAVSLAIPPDKTLFAGALILLGFGLGGTNMLSWSMLAVLVARSTRMRARAATIYGCYTAASKIASGLSALMLGLLLTWFDVLDSASAANPIALYAAAWATPAIGCGLSFICTLAIARRFPKLATN